MHTVREPNFGQLPPAQSSWETSATVVLPVPFERTVSYGHGTALGPAAIIAASSQVEFYDEELGFEPCQGGIATVPPCDPITADLATAMAEIEAAALPHLEAGKFLVTLGGEHSLTLGPVRAAAKVHGPIGVVQFDAHADLRDSYEGSPFSHASIMRRLLELELPSLAIGIRALSSEEATLVKERRLPMIWGYELEGAELRFKALLDALPEKVYLTFDLDFFDPSLIPATGTPEPGGGTWWPTMRLLRTLFESKDVVAMDVVELAPAAGQHASDFTAARLVYKCVGYRARGRRLR